MPAEQVVAARRPRSAAPLNRPADRIVRRSVPGLFCLAQPPFCRGFRSWNHGQAMDADLLAAGFTAAVSTELNQGRSTGSRSLRTQSPQTELFFQGQVSAAYVLRPGVALSAGAPPGRSAGPQGHTASPEPAGIVGPSLRPPGLPRTCKAPEPPCCGCASAPWPRAAPVHFSLRTTARHPVP